MKESFFKDSKAMHRIGFENFAKSIARSLSKLGLPPYRTIIALEWLGWLRNYFGMTLGWFWNDLGADIRISLEWLQDDFGMTSGWLWNGFGWPFLDFPILKGHIQGQSTQTVFF